MTTLKVWVGLSVFLVPSVLWGANPPGGTISEASPIASWTGPIKPATASATCNGPNDAACDNFALTIVPPSPAFGPFLVEIKLQPALLGDWDMQVYRPGGAAGPSSGNAPGQVELVFLSNPTAGTYTVAAAPFAPMVGPDVDGDLLPDSYSATATIKKQDVPPPPPPGEVITYFNHVPPPPLGQPGTDEPSIGCNYNSDKVMFLGRFDTYRVNFDDCSSPAQHTWEDVSFITTSLASADPILFTDRVTGRTFVSQLAGKTSLMAFTDNDGNSWTPSQGAGINSGVDHQTVGGGPYNESAVPPPPPHPLYPHAVYYCSQDIATAQCARSDTGGLTFGPAVPIYNLTECGGLHGHIQVSDVDGTVYVPNKGCNGEQAVVASEDNGITWDVRKVPGAAAGETDPSVGVARDGTLYFGWDNGGIDAMAAVSRDKGLNWINYQNVGAPFGVTNTVFPAVVAGDSNRAAFAFHGSSNGPPGTGGVDDPNWPGDWYLYVAHTYDGGLTWTTVNATPNDPVQRGTIFTGGFDPQGSATRNLLDFFGATIDRFGRVLVGYADGCIGPCVLSRPNSFTARSTIARQVSGRRMYAEFDGPAAPSAPAVMAIFDNCPNANRSLVHLSWSTPDDRGSPITGYNVYRRTSSGSFGLIASVAAGINTYDDSVDPNQNYFYQVTAVNALGEGAACGEHAPGCPGDVSENPCVVPGMTVLTDPSGDDLPPSQAQLDIESVSFAGLLTDGPPHMVVTTKVGSLSTVPANASWRTVWTFNAVNYFVAMNNCSLAGVTFTYGTLSGNLFTTVGNADDGEFSAEGAIRITIAASKVGNPAAGQDLTSVNARTQTFVGAECSGLLLTEDSTENGSFRLSSCVAGTPVAQDDEASTTENIPVLIHVLANDSDPNGDPLTVISVKQPANGTATNNGDGTVTYSPNTGFFGSDSFTYTISDPGGLTDTANVAVTVVPFCPLVPTGRFFDDLEPAPEPGWGMDTTVNTLGPASPTWQVLPDPNATSPIQSWFSDATTLDLKDDRLVAPSQDLSSTSQLIFWHRFRFEETFDGGVLEVTTDGGSTWVDVEAAGGVFVLGGYNGTIDTGFNSPIAGRRAWTGGFLDAVLAPMEQVIVDLGALGGLGVRVRFRLACDEIAIGATPGHGWWIDDVEFTNTLEVSDCEGPPNAENDMATTTENTPVTIDVLANDSDPEGGPLTVESVSQPANGTATTDGTTVTYSPNAGFVGDDAFEYTIRDNQNLSDTATVAVTVLDDGNRPPEAVDDMAATQQDTSVTIAVLANDTDPDGDPLTVTDAGDPPNGTTVVNPDGTVTYTPDAGFTGTDSFTYTISDGTDSDSAIVTVTVNPAPTGNVEVTGGGWIPSASGGKSNFGFNAQRQGAASATGRISYDSGNGGISLKGTVDALSITGSQATFSGPCERRDTGAACTYTADVEDNGEPGAGADRFTITVRDAGGSVIHTHTGILGGGNIQVH